jgi:hypothetical protein
MPAQRRSMLCRGGAALGLRGRVPACSPHGGARRSGDDRAHHPIGRRRDRRRLPRTEYDLVPIFDALHDVLGPLGAARHIREALKPDGTFLLVEPFANDMLEDNINPVGRTYYGRPRSSVWPTR